MKTKGKVYGTFKKYGGCYQGRSKRNTFAVEGTKIAIVDIDEKAGQGVAGLLFNTDITKIEELNYVAES